MEHPERISVSRDALRAELAELELRLTKQLASRSDVEDVKNEQGRMALHISALQDLGKRNREDIESLDSRVVELRDWHNRSIGIIALIAFLMPVLATISWHLWG